jgi:beta-lactamase superfamily II metal-dependent hydrolase
MRVEIFDVGQGQCAVITSPNGRRLIIDCGHRLGDNRFWSPSLHFRGEFFDLLALSNLDEDHICNFEFMLRNVRIGQILSNPTIGAGELSHLKKDGMGAGARAVANWMSNPFKGPPAPLPDFGPVKIRWYYNPFVPGVSTETNDLSLVIFAEYCGFKIMFSGDMEKVGWQRLLRYPSFCYELIGTNIFVASHHGRENGQCAELFTWLRPEIIVISDDEKEHQSQETTGWYAERCTGAIVIDDPRQRRFVMTTRKDGSMRVDVFPNGAWILQSMHVQDWPVGPPRISRPAGGLGLPTAFSPAFKPASAGLGLGVSNPFLQR